MDNEPTSIEAEVANAIHVRWTWYYRRRRNLKTGVWGIETGANLARVAAVTVLLLSLLVEDPYVVATYLLAVTLCLLVQGFGHLIARTRWRKYAQAMENDFRQMHAILDISLEQMQEGIEALRLQALRDLDMEENN